MRNTQNSFIVFTIQNERYALRASCIMRIIRLVEITKIREESNEFLGIINVQGEIIPVLNINAILNLGETETKLNDCIVIIQYKEQVLAFVVSEVNFIEVEEKSILPKKSIFQLAEIPTIEGIIKDSAGPIQLLNLDNLNSLIGRFSSLPTKETRDSSKALGGR